MANDDSQPPLIGSTSDRPESPSEADEFHLAADRETIDELQRVLSPDCGPNASEGERGAFCVITQSRGTTRVTYNISEALTPEEGQVTYPGGLDEEIDLTDLSLGEIREVLATNDVGLQYSAEYRRRARQAAAAVDGGGLMIVHTHPFGRAHPNPIDREAARRNLHGAAQELPPDAPLAAALYSESGSWHARAIEMNVARTRAQSKSNEFGTHTATETDATAIRVVGSDFEKLPTTATEDLMGPAGVDGEINPDLVDSSRRLWELEGQETLAGLRVGIIGCGGGGSILAEWLPRLGVGEVVLVDYDYLEPANFNRHQGATRTDVENERLKVRVSGRVAEGSATATEFQVRPVVGSVVESKREAFDPLPHLLDCDIIMNASDMDWGRKVLDDLAFAHLIPVFDGGSPIDTDDDGVLTEESYSTISLSVPGGVCLRCADVWEPDEVANDQEFARSQGYVDDEDEERAPSVISQNGLVESLAIQRLQAVVLGVAPDLTTGALRYYPRMPELKWRLGVAGELVDCLKSCDRASLTGGGDAAFADTYRYADPNLGDLLDDGDLEPNDGGVVDVAENNWGSTQTKRSSDRRSL